MEDMALDNVLRAFYQGKKVFLTGHTGFKGAWLVAWLHRLGAVVKGYSLPPENDRSLYQLIQSSIECEDVYSDILDKDHLQSEIVRFEPDIVIHMAAQALVRRSYREPAYTFDVNVTGTANVLEAVLFLDRKVSVLLVTTDKVYENREIDYYYTEEDRLGGYDPYSASKAAAELVINSFRNSFFNLNKISAHQKVIVSARAGNVIGGGDWSEDRLIPDIVRSLERSQPVQIRNPDSVRPWQFVLEPLGGYLLAAMKAYNDPLFFSGAYNFGPQKNDHLKVRELADIAIRAWGIGNWEEVKESGKPHEAGLLQLDISKARDVLNWEPKLQSRQALEWTMEWYRQPLEYKNKLTLSQIDHYAQL